MKTIRNLLYLCLLPVLAACEDVVNIDVTPAPAQLVIDAFINNRDTVQTIRLTQTVPYFELGNAPAVAGAEVLLTNRTTGRTFAFADADNDGTYAWTPAGPDSIGAVGHEFSLSVRHQTDTYQAQSRLERTTRVDSITYEKREAGPGDAKEGYYAQFYGTDLLGKRDFYWIRSFRNGRNQVRLFSYATNGIGGTDNVNGADGFPFIPPIRESITDETAPFAIGDMIRVEIWSVTEETLDFFIQAEGQINNSGLFARPPENVRTNFANTTNPRRRAVGWFNTSAVSGLSVKVVENR